MSSTPKPVVYYHTSVHIALGGPAYVYPINHPSDLVTNTKMVRTSTVIRIDGPEFETENTIYQPEGWL